MTVEGTCSVPTMPGRRLPAAHFRTDKMDRCDPVVADVRSALVRQWELISEVVDTIDLAAASRCNGWTNREVLAHLYVQPYLVEKFLCTASVRQARGATLGESRWDEVISRS